MSEQEKGKPAPPPAHPHHTEEYRQKLIMACETVREGLGIKGLLLIACFDDGCLECSSATRGSLIKILMSLPSISQSLALQLTGFQSQPAPATPPPSAEPGYEI